MVLRISGKNVDIGQALRTRIDEALPGIVGKYFSGAFSGHVTVSKTGRDFVTDCAIHLDTGMLFESHASAADAHASFDVAAERLDKRLRRYKRRLKDHKKPQDNAPEPAESYASFVISGPDEEEELAEDFAPAIVAETRTPIHTMSVSAAVLELDRTEAPVIVFRNSKNNGINVVYRRRDGNFGWIDPALNPTTAES